jgi:hypothetical protein
MDRLESGKGAYPATTIDVIKLLREAGLSVEYAEAREDRAQVGHNAADMWIPVLVFMQQISWDVVVSYLTTVLTGLIGTPGVSNRRLHVKVGRRSADGSERFFESSGTARDVLDAMREAGLDD